MYVDEFMVTRKMPFLRGRNNHVNVNGNYVDGISITRGSPRKHLLTYVTGAQANLVVTLVTLNVLVLLAVGN